MGKCTQCHSDSLWGDGVIMCPGHMLHPGGHRVGAPGGLNPAPCSMLPTAAVKVLCPPWGPSRTGGLGPRQNDHPVEPWAVDGWHLLMKLRTFSLRKKQKVWNVYWQGD